jgi:hypothetical protein
VLGLADAGLLGLAGGALLFIADGGVLGLADRELLGGAGGKLPFPIGAEVAIKGAAATGGPWPLTTARMGCGLTVCPELGKAAKGAAIRSGS